MRCSAVISAFSAILRHLPANSGVFLNVTPVLVIFQGDNIGACGDAHPHLDKLPATRWLITELWPRLEDHKYRWELHSYGLPEGYDKLVISDIIDLLIEALKGIGVADNKLLQAHTKADHHNPSNPDAA
jgi:hypothetical protein